ncbi:hypothetical protein OG21DRAFT_1511788 [Imleria badia]|nr:hypothetical protein OG21DRAFT_1511788 [Imleria badia]
MGFKILAYNGAAGKEVVSRSGWTRSKSYTSVETDANDRYAAESFSVLPTLNFRTQPDPFGTTAETCADGFSSRQQDTMGVHRKSRLRERASVE